MQPTATRAGISGARVLITGATGLLGRQVFRVFEEHGWCTRGLGLARAKGHIVRCDLLNAEDLEAQFDDFRPTIVVHCAAERRPDALEEDRAYATKINVDLTHDIGKLCRERGVWMIYISTNYVFDGKEAPYAEDAVPRPVNTYGESKYAGERAVAEVHPDAATVRVPLLYGPIEYVGETSVTALLGTIQKEAPRLDNWQERFPTCTEDAAHVLEAFCAAQVSRGEQSPERFRGIFHWQSNERHTKYTMAMVIAEIAGVDSAGFVSVDEAPPPEQAPRPQFERMLCGRLERVLAQAGEGDCDRFRSSFAQSLARNIEPFLPRR
uniref:RmlD-like substrate binding domain-containing protein n=1 Tax=Alexandrium monilatum TaxID=311494 RepID=A0A7S4ULL3_9DINO